MALPTWLRDTKGLNYTKMFHNVNAAAIKSRLEDVQERTCGAGLSEVEVFQEAVRETLQATQRSYYLVPKFEMDADERYPVDRAPPPGTLEESLASMWDAISTETTVA